MADIKKKKKRDRNEVELFHGKFYFPNGDYYDGEYCIEDGFKMRHGQGKHLTAQGIQFEGSWVKDKMDGTGKVQFPSGAVYEGQLRDNQFHGIGRYSWPNGCIYKGQFIENRLEGSGTFQDEQGQIWEGQFKHKVAPALKFQLNL